MAINVATVFIVDDQPAFRLGLRSILEQAEDVSMLGECSLSEKAVELVGRSQPRLALVGTTPLLHLGLDICRRIGQRSLGDHVIVMTHEEESGELFEAIRSGAWSYVSKLADAPTLLRAIHEAGQENMPIQHIMQGYPEVTRRLLEEFQTMARDPRWREFTAPLSHREMEMLRQLGGARSNKEIAHILSIAPQTVKNQITAILRKLNVNDRTQAVLAGLATAGSPLEGSP